MMACGFPSPWSVGSTRAVRSSTSVLGGREALLRYVLRPPLAQERLLQRPDGLVRITLKKAYTDGTVAVDMERAGLRWRRLGRTLMNRSIWHW